MNPAEMIVLIVAIVMIASVFKTRAMASRRHRGEDDDSIENQRLRAEVKELKDRLQVLERIATDRENTLSRQIEELRDR